MSVAKDSVESIDFSDVQIVHKFAISKTRHYWTLNITEMIQDRHMITTDH